MSVDRVERRVTLVTTGLTWSIHLAPLLNNMLVMYEPKARTRYTLESPGGVQILSKSVYGQFERWRIQLYTFHRIETTTATSTRALAFLPFTTLLLNCTLKLHPIVALRIVFVRAKRRSTMSVCHVTRVIDSNKKKSTFKKNNTYYHHNNSYPPLTSHFVLHSLPHKVYAVQRLAMSTEEAL